MSESGAESSFCADKICTADLSDDGALAIYCDVCGDLYCIKCMGVASRKNFDIVTNCKNIKMVCNGCLNFTFSNLCKKNTFEDNMKEKMDDITRNLNEVGANIGRQIDEQIKKKFESLKLDKISEKIDSLPVEMNKSYSKALEQNRNKDTEENIVSSVGKIVRTTINENKQEQDKEEEIERSVIINGMEEDDVKNYDERIANETEKVTNLINNGVKIQMPEIKKIQRIGKYNPDRNFPRPIRVTFLDKFNKNKVLRNASNLKKAEDKYKSCYINKEMNNKEKEEYQEEIKKAKEMNEHEANKNKFFVVRGHPSQWKIVEKVRKMKE